MSIQICGAPCCWGVDDPKNPYLPPWTRVLEEAGKAGYSAIELGPYGYLPIDAELVANELKKNGLAIVAGTIFHDLLDADNQESVLHAVDDICRLITDPKLPVLKTHDGQKFPTPYMTVMDWGHDERDYAAGHPGHRTAPVGRGMGALHGQRPRGMRARKQMGRSSGYPSACRRLHRVCRRDCKGCPRYSV